MPGISRDRIKHSLNVDRKAKPIKQKLRWFRKNKKEAIRIEVTRLLAVGFIKEVYHLDWLANPILVCTDLNKHCPKDPFVLPCIDEAVDSTAGCELLSFLDCYSGYHQIALNKDDQIKTSFITPFRTYCYTTMSFGLKNARATYQRAIQECLKKEIQDELVEAYVDDVVVKTKESHSLIDNLTHTFAALNQYQWKLNPKKCIFGIPSSILLGNVVSHDGIHPNPEKVQAVLNMKRLANVKDV
jgi:hypothetical protein